MNSLSATSTLSLKLSELLPELSLPKLVANTLVSGIKLDSRDIQTADIFVALKGLQLNGETFIGNAVELGASAILVEADQDRKAGNVNFVGTVPVISVGQLAQRVSALAGQIYAEPSTVLDLIGVTGTNGKSTCVSLIAQLEKQLGRSSASIGTLGVDLNGTSVGDFGMTTPDACTTQILLAQLVEQKAKSVSMEVSSHALHQNRVAGLKFLAGVFTNIGHDHLDYHPSLEHYAASKIKLFETIGMQSAVVNLDDPFSSRVVSAAKKHTKVLSYSLLNYTADVFASELRYSPFGVCFNIKSPWGSTEVESPLLGEFNVYNLLAAITCLAGLGRDFNSVVAACKRLLSVPGRMQNLKFQSDISVIVDYAHTPDALVQAIAATRSHTAGKLWVVFGCGGDRDNSKRPLMAQVVEKYADCAVVTSDNPRTEDPQAIIDQVLSGFSKSTPAHFVDRKQAIDFAISNADATDVIILAGKGHEKYQIIGKDKYDFDEVKLALEALEQRNNKIAWSNQG